MRTATISGQMCAAVMSLPALVGLLLFPLASRPVLSDSPDVMGSASAALSEMETTWKYEDLKLLDPWGDSAGDGQDIVAVYEKEASDNRLYFRVDVLDMQGEARPNLFLAIDYRPGGSTTLVRGKPALTSDLQWELLMSFTSAGQGHLYDLGFTDQPNGIVHMNVDSQLDFIEFAIARDALLGWDGTPFKIQAIALSDDGNRIADKTAPVATDAATGRGKLVLVFGNMFTGSGPHAISWYDGFAFRPPDRPPERTGLKYLLDAAEKYRVPVTTIDLRVDVLAANEYLGINDRLRSLARRGLLDPLPTLTYGYFFPWQPADVDARALQMARDTWEDLDLPQGKVFYPYEAMLTGTDLEAIKKTGYSAIYGTDHYAYWFGWIHDWGNWAEVVGWNRKFRKIHRVNDLLVFFGGPAFAWDSRWNKLQLDQGWYLLRYDSFVGTDGGLHHAWRRVLLDMALDADQEQYIMMGNDLWQASWYLPEDANRNMRWIASHPWIDATTFNDLLKRNWTPVDHGDLGLAPNQPLDRYYPAEGGYNDYFWQFYYGGVSDGHSPMIPAGVKIEGYFDYIPYLRDGQPIPSGRKMGDDRTPGTIVYETLRNLRAAPDNALARLAWRAYFTTISEQTFHAGEKPDEGTGGPYLYRGAKALANLVRQVNKIVAGAVWAEGAARGRWTARTQVVSADLDLDGEDEHVLQNDRLFAIFEDDGARLEYAFAYDPSVGPVALVAPFYVTMLPGRTDFEAGESPPETSGIEVAFEDAAWGENKRFRSDRFSVQADTDSLTFSSPDGRLKKTFRLEGNTLLAHYATHDIGDLTIGFALPVGLLGLYSPGWWERIKPVSTKGNVGWQAAGEGYAVVNLLDTRLNTYLSFLDSPARKEMRERNDQPYTPGHWQPFPFGEVSVVGRGKFDVSLTLAARAPAPTAVATQTVPASPGTTPGSAVATSALPSDSPVEALRPILPFCVGIMAIPGIMTAAFLAVRHRRGRRDWTRR